MKVVKYIIFFLIFVLLFIFNLTIKMDLLLRLLNPLIICIILCLYRIAVGPTAADRAVGVDILGIIVVGSCAFLTLVTKKDFFIDIAVAWALQSFIGTIALSKYLEGRHLDD